MALGLTRVAGECDPASDHSREKNSISWETVWRRKDPIHFWALPLANFVILSELLNSSNLFLPPMRTWDNSTSFNFCGY